MTWGFLCQPNVLMLLFPLQRHDTVLMKACAAGTESLPLAQLLVARGADVNAICPVRRLFYSVLRCLRKFE